MTAQPPTKLKLIRLARGLSQREVAALAGVRPVQVSNVERGLVVPNVLDKIGAALGVEPDTLLERSWDLAATHDSLLEPVQEK